MAQGEQSDEPQRFPKLARVSIAIRARQGTQLQRLHARKSQNRRHRHAKDRQAFSLMSLEPTAVAMIVSVAQSVVAAFGFCRDSMN